MREDDDVDLVIDAWAEALPDLDFAPLDVVSRLRRLSPRVQEVRRRSFAVSDLAPWEFELLSLLRQNGASGMTPSALSLRLALSSGTLANRVDRLAARGLVVREQNAADSRSKIVSLTPRGTKRVDEAMRHLVAAEGEVLGGLDPRQVSVLIECLRTISDTLDELD
ncbi:MULTISPECIES: MarR family winged helix-turn-helix transcriptional regulator [unclassified Rathayibacter]|uniref:MarR family winged helix-turn-helix transcriptional regulator n=1 Tax=unclassified Rathayibacter TaxID=2609250 RepID=UPI001889D86D|nr:MULTISPECIES: MarR family transcriptional regulator [unclassified Rathayibacter]MBF4461773.1 MarR family transcriptional regulator [Rathayibacter sp. VKM Ac-2879]MBF4503185.1 MarR family transcriptional regulator [Rathayibacter sp. VKM Ac-2878]